MDISKESLEKDFLKNFEIKEKHRPSLHTKLEAAKKKATEENKKRKLELSFFDK